MKLKNLLNQSVFNLIPSLFAPNLQYTNMISSLTNGQSKGQHSFHNAHSTTYERMAGGCTNLVAQHIVTSLSAPPTSPYSLPRPHPITPTSHILDNACGSGLVTSIIKSAYPFARITAADLAPAMVARVEEKIEAEQWEGVDTAVMDAIDLSRQMGADGKGFKDEMFTHAIANFGIHAGGAGEPDGPLKAVKEMYRVLKSGGICVVSTWAGELSLHSVSPLLSSPFQIFFPF
jgi:SAM-dependent methyltransferase